MTERDIPYGIPLPKQHPHSGTDFEPPERKPQVGDVDMKLGVHAILTDRVNIADGGSAKIRLKDGYVSLTVINGKLHVSSLRQIVIETSDRKSVLISTKSSSMKFKNS